MNIDTKTIAIIPARGGSKGLRFKNLRMLGGESLVARVVRHALEASTVDKVLLTTDDEQIAEAGLRAGAEVPFLRPPDLAQDLSTTEETLQHALLSYEEYAKQKFDICVFLSPTDIFRKSEWIDEAVSTLDENPQLDSVFCGYKTHKNYWELDEAGNWTRLRDWMAKYASRQVRRTIVREDTGLACASRAQLWRMGKRIGDNVHIIITEDDFTSIDIHTEEDLFLAEKALEIRALYKKT